MPISGVPLDIDTHAPLADPKQEAEVRCLLLLKSCEMTYAKLLQHVPGYTDAATNEAVNYLVEDVLAHAATLGADLQILADALGCTITVAGEPKGEVH